MQHQRRRGGSMRRWAVLLLAVGLAGCAVDDSGPVRSLYRPDPPKSTYSAVVYVTDRVADAAAAGGYSTRWAGQPSCGVAEAIIPPATAPGGEPQYGYVAKTWPKQCSDGKARLAAAIAAIQEQAKARNCHSVFLFVHGFHTGFDGGVLRAAQVAADADTGCAVAAFSWSAEINVDHYVSDIEHSDYAQPLFAEFLRELSETDLRVTIVAHSLGTRLTLMTLSGLGQSRQPPRSGFVDELVLAAGDVGADPANNDFQVLMTGAAPFAKRTTIYVSSYDSVLKISTREHGGVPRLGNGVDLAFNGDKSGHVVDIIDASEAPADRLDHSYYALSRETMADMAKVLRGVSLQERLKADPATVLGTEPPAANTRLKAPGPRFVTRLIITLLPLAPIIK